MTFAPMTTAKTTVWRLLSRLGLITKRDVGTKMSRIEEDLFGRYVLPLDAAPIIFILASPRTGSTLLYQLMAKHLRLHFFSNYVATHFSGYPLVGTVIESALTDELADGVSLRNRYGQTEGSHEPNEATKILDHWFRHEHPSATLSSRVRRGTRTHLTNTISGIAAFAGKPIVVKNTWNCFRVTELANLFPAARFIWLRRDIAASSYSALQARKRQGDPATVWNSASPANFSEIRRLPYIEQVVEQQYWTNAAVEDDLRRRIHPGNWIEVWYEDIVADPVTVLETIASSFSFPHLRQQPKISEIRLQPSRHGIESEDYTRILRYARSKYAGSVRQ